MAPTIEEYGVCPDCGKPFEEAMGLCRGCGTERPDLTIGTSMDILKF